MGVLRRVDVEWFKGTRVGWDISRFSAGESWGVGRGIGAADWPIRDGC